MAFRVGIVFALGEAFFVLMLLSGCRLESSINDLSIGLTVCCYSRRGRFWGGIEIICKYGRRFRLLRRCLAPVIRSTIAQSPSNGSEGIRTYLERSSGSAS